MSEVRSGGQECQAATAQEQPRSYPTSEVRGGGWEEQPQPPRTGGCTGTGGLTGAMWSSARSGGIAVRRYPSSQVRSSGCALLEQP